MKELLYKEWKLAIHPTNLLFLGLSVMLLIPNYPYYVTFFYTMLGVFFLCLSGRENNDIPFTLSLPVRKRDIVRARIAIVTALQLLQVLLAVPFAVLRQNTGLPGNQAGMDANIAFFGLAFLLLGIANFLFFTRYYKDPNQVGKAFVLTSIVVMAYILAAESCCFIVPFFRDVLDTPDPAFLPQKLAVLGTGFICYFALTILACHKGEKRFEALDL